MFLRKYEKTLQRRSGIELHIKGFYITSKCTMNIFFNNRLDYLEFSRSGIDYMDKLKEVLGVTTLYPTVSNAELLYCSFVYKSNNEMHNNIKEFNDSISKIKLINIAGIYFEEFLFFKDYDIEYAQFITDIKQHSIIGAFINNTLCTLEDIIISIQCSKLRPQPRHMYAIMVEKE